MMVFQPWSDAQNFASPMRRTGDFEYLHPRGWWATIVKVRRISTQRVGWASCESTPIQDDSPLFEQWMTCSHASIGLLGGWMFTSNIFSTVDLRDLTRPGASLAMPTRH